jgi:protein involved in polysaccharide export with SLBB domain
MKNPYSGDLMKRFIFLLLMLLLLNDCSFAQVSATKLKFAPALSVAVSATQPAATKTANPLLATTPANGEAGEKDDMNRLKDSAAVEADKNSPDYYRQRLQQLEAVLFERTRQEIIQEKSRPESATSSAQPEFYDERETEKKKRLLTFDEKEIDRETELRLETEIMLKNFGKDFFEQGEISHATLFSGAAPSSYLLGPGDQLKIIVWSELGDETVYDVEVNPEGQVYVPILGVLGVSGITAGEFEQMVIGRLSGKFAHFKGQVTLTKVRTMQIFVVGEVEKPGAQSLSGLGTAFTALYQAGGPTVRGSMRNIRILDTKGTAKEIDLYRYLLSGDRSQDLPLKNGDTVFVPAVGEQIKVSGLVVRPAIYEIKAQTSLADALQMAGNVQAQAYMGRVRVSRWSGDQRRQTFDLSLRDENALKGFILHNGDEIKVDRGIETIGNGLVVEGAVAKPGDYSFAAGMKVADLISRAGGLVAEEANTEHGQIYRKSSAGKEEVLPFNVKFALLGDKEHNRELMPLDRIRVFAQKDIVADTRIVTVDGAVRRPGQYIYRDGMRLADLVVNAKGLAIDAAGEVEIARIRDGDKSEIIRANVNTALTSANSSDNVALMPLDRISVMARADRLMEAEVVMLKGQVKYPGPYALEYRGEPLSSVISRAGGLTRDAFAEGTIFMRRIENVSSEKQLETANNVQNEMFRQATLDLRSDLLRAGAKLDSMGDMRSEIQGGTVNQQVLDLKNADAVGASATAAVSAGVIGVAGETSSFGGIEMRSRSIENQMVRIPVPLKDILDGKADDFEDISLLDGDQITIPVLPRTVSVLGAVINPTTILYNKNRDARYYINRAGGFSSHSDHRRTVVIKANGEVLPMRSVRRINRGDIVLVPPKPRLVKPDKLKEFGNIASILGNLAVTYKVVNDANK